MLINAIRHRCHRLLLQSPQSTSAMHAIPTCSLPICTSDGYLTRPFVSHLDPQSVRGMRGDHSRDISTRCMAQEGDLEVAAPSSSSREGGGWLFPFLNKPEESHMSTFL